MDLVNVNLYAEAYYSGVAYEDNIWIKKSSYEKLKDKFPTEISCGELDGKHNEVIGEVEVQDGLNTDEEYAKAGNRGRCDGDFLELSLEDLYYANNIDFDKEQEEINKFFHGLDQWVDVEVSVPESKVDELLKFTEKLKQK